MNLIRRALPVFFIMSSGLDNVSSSASVDSKLAFASVPLEDSSSEQETSANTSASESIPQLPAADPNADIPCLKLGETIKFDQMGPVIINLDGTTRRIENWEELTENEKEVTWRRISKRNEERRKMLLERMKEQETSKAQDD